MPSKDDTRAGRGPGAGRGAGKGKSPDDEDPGLITRVERAARSIGVDLPTRSLREIRDVARGEGASAATDAAGWLAADAKAQAAAGIIVILVDEQGEMVARRDFGRRARKR